MFKRIGIIKMALLKIPKQIGKMYKEIKNSNHFSSTNLILFSTNIVILKDAV